MPRSDRKAKPSPKRRSFKRNGSPARAGSPARGGVFTAAPDPAFTAINASLDVDRRLWAEDLAGSRAHAAMLAEQKIISAKDHAAIRRGLKAIEAEIKSGRFPWRADREDVHMNIEARLAERIGTAAGRLHTARSRNDQVATDFRLWVRGACDRALANLITLQETLLALAARHTETPFPGFTHLQPAQPITFAHHLHAYSEMFFRDADRLLAARHRMNECPLGSAALAGTPYPIDRKATARALGFARVMENTLDAVSARDFALDYLSAAAILATHLSRLAEEIVLWSTPAFGLVRLSDRVTSGSSIMPQKRNPDAAELIRAKPGRMAGALMQLLMILKALPLAYNKDLQDDKAPVFAAADDLEQALAAMTAMLKNLSLNVRRAGEMAAAGYTTATDLADHLVRAHHLPFRAAHHLTGSIVRLAMERSVALQDLPLKDMQALAPMLTRAVFKKLTVSASIRARKSQGGPAPDAMRRALKDAQKKLAALKQIANRKNR